VSAELLREVVALTLVMAAAVVVFLAGFADGYRRGKRDRSA
jgi:hypothetical protein